MCGVYNVLGEGLQWSFGDDLKMVIMSDFGFADFHVGFCTTTVVFV